MAPIQMTAMQPGLPPVRCVCDGGGPPLFGQALVGCGTCKVWHHQICLVPDSIVEMVRRGWKCGECKRKVLQQTAAGRHQPQTTQGNTGRLFSFSARANERQRRKKREWYEAEEELDSKYLRAREQRSHGLVVLKFRERLGEFIAESYRYSYDRDVKPRPEKKKEAPPPPPTEIQCDCPEDDINPTLDYHVCSNCNKGQHRACVRVHRIPPKTKRSKVLCNGCRSVLVEKQLSLATSELYQATQLLVLEREALRDYIDNTLWKSYCEIPNNPISTPALKELTSMLRQDGVPKPIHPTPIQWTDETEDRIRLLMERAGQDMMAESLTIDIDLNIKYDYNFTFALRDMSLWMLKQPQWRAKRTDLGIVAEIIGLESKGTYWKP